MNDPELELFEKDLQRLKPAAPPEDLMAGMTSCVAGKSSEICPEQRRVSPKFHWAEVLRWMIPTAGVAGLALFLVCLYYMPPNGGVDEVHPVVATAAPAAAHPNATPDEIELDRQLVAAYEGVAELPGGLPLRFRCYDWNQQFVLRDTDGALEVEQTGPWLEIVPVRFEVY